MTPDDVKTPRRYHSPTRQSSATTTRDAIADAAAALFRARGYGASTITAIAHDAGVAPQTVYAVYRSKRAILLKLVARAKQARRRQRARRPGHVRA